jgi:hypothetical protein
MFPVEVAVEEAAEEDGEERALWDTVSLAVKLAVDADGAVVNVLPDSVYEVVAVVHFANNAIHNN